MVILALKLHLSMYLVQEVQEVQQLLLRVAGLLSVAQMIPCVCLIFDMDTHSGLWEHNCHQPREGQDDGSGAVGL